MRLVWHSNSPTNNSGYGKQTALFVPRIAALGHEIAAIAAPYSFGGCPIEWDGIPILGTVRDTAGNDTLIRNHEFFKADLTITLCDPFGLAKASPEFKQINIAHWFPVDCAPLGRGDAQVLRDGMGIPIAMSSFGREALLDEGAEPFYVPHGVDTSLYCPGDPYAYRDTIDGVTDDTFVIGMCAMNRDMQRKGFFEQFMAFARFHERHPDSVLAVHSTPAAHPGLNLSAMTARLGITSAVTFPDTYSYDLGLISEEQMVSWYRGLDVLSMCSYAEGFGIPLIEAQACGVPVITTNASAMTELCGVGWLVSGTPFWADGHSAMWKRPDVTDIEQAYEAAWSAREQGALPRKQAREFALQFDVDRVTDLFWKPCLDSIQDYIEILQA